MVVMAAFGGLVLLGAVFAALRNLGHHKNSHIV